MLRFDYYAKDSKGISRKGIVEAVDQSQAAKILKEKGLVLVSLKRRTEGILSLIKRKIFSHVGTNDIVNFTRQLATMINAGLVITDALTILKAQTENPAMIAIIDSLQKDIEGGSSLSDALKKNSQVFDPVYISLVRSGETAGVLDKILTRLADNLEKQREFVGKIKGAMVYPAIIVSGMVLVGGVMMIFVIPKLLALYQEFQAKLPTSTVILIAMSKFLSKFWWLILALGVGGIFGYKAMNKTEGGRLKIDALISALPIIGKLRKALMLTEFSRTFGLLIEGGILVVEALSVTEGSVSSSIYKRAIATAAKEVERGASLSVALAKTEAFPPLLPQMISVGEETGKLDEVLAKIAYYFEQEAEVGIRNLTTAVEPLVMIMLGIGVGFLVVAVIMPIYNLTSSF